jgi:cell shape-determining protein MreC
MSITDRFKGTQEMKTPQTNLKTTQTMKQERQVELEPLEEQAAHMISQLEEEKKIMAHAQTDTATLMQEEIASQSVEALTDEGKGKGTSRKVPHFG